MAHCISMNDVCFHKTIREMRKGEHGWTVPWAYDPSDGQISLHHITHPNPHGTAEMRIECIVPETLYHAWPPGDHRYRQVTERGKARCIHDYRHNPRKKSCVEFGECTPHSFFVWTDLSTRDISSIPGITWAYAFSSDKLYSCPGNKYRVTFDPRYDIQDIQDEIRFLAEIQ